mmetsp:Transcript_104166/g.299474  ORF Transcript_104166/g.299474 Transcript_104166/m.299474 type:complete len:220 (-) Transcript_104166:13-672(-)
MPLSCRAANSMKRVQASMSTSWARRWTSFSARPACSWTRASTEASASAARRSTSSPGATPAPAAIHWKANIATVSWTWIAGVSSMAHSTAVTASAAAGANRSATRRFTGNSATGSATGSGFCNPSGSGTQTGTSIDEALVAAKNKVSASSRSPAMPSANSWRPTRPRRSGEAPRTHSYQKTGRSMMSASIAAMAASSSPPAVCHPLYGQLARKRVRGGE